MAFHLCLGKSTLIFLSDFEMLSVCGGDEVVNMCSNIFVFLCLAVNHDLFH